MRDAFVWTDEAAIDEFLRAREIGHLTTLDEDGWPHTVPLDYVWQGGAVFFHTGLGAKMEHLRRNPKVSFVVTEVLSVLGGDFTASPCRQTHLGRSVLIRGLAREVTAPERKLLVLNKFAAKYDPAVGQPSEQAQMNAESLVDQPGFAACQVVEIEVVGLTARQHLLPNKPEKYRKAAAAYFQRRGQATGDARDLKTAQLLSQTYD